MTKIFLIRHAEAEGNIFRRAHGHQQGQITKRGHVQIKQLRDRFKDETIDVVYSSDLDRTCVTATAVAEPRGLEIHKTPDLREVNMGAWEDMAWGDIEYHHKEMGYNFGFDPARWHVASSETYEAVIARMTRFINTVAERHNDQTIALFSHGFAIRSFFCRLMNIESKDCTKLPYCDNTAVALLSYDNGVFHIEYQGDNSHLCYEESTFAHQKWWRDDKNWVTENLRFTKLDAKRDAQLRQSYCTDVGKEPCAELEYMAYLADDPAGIVGFDVLNEHRGEIKYMYLLPEFQNQNLGVQLIGTAIADLRKLRKRHLEITVPKDSPAQKLCSKHGFEVISESKSDVLMEKDIKNWHI
ncbi:MAG: bifunctional histidine phosphatase family protein/GNAT family N-acetyltransferase [Oscillospiraceae bacterium]|nr:bifunctional histidine phosphatase family protein/GNAT family N-acetyltransferase [Oscillospiraceae bacterium]